MARQGRRPPPSPSSPLEALRRLWRATDPRDPGTPRSFSLGDRPAPVSNPLAPDRQAPDLTVHLKENVERLREIFDASRNSDVIFRQFRLALQPPRDACLVYVEGLTDRTTESSTLLQPLMLLAGLNPEAKTSGGVLDAVEGSLAPAAAVAREQTLAATVEKIMTGMTALLIDGSREALLVETKGWDHRSVERPQAEPAVRGPQDSFTETLRVNTALVRRRLRTPDLMMEPVKVGKLTQTDVVIAHIRHLSNPKLVEEVRRRLRNIKLDYAASSGIVEHMIQDRPWSLFPQVLATERPDRVSAALSEGYVAILVDTSPYVLVVPATFTTAIHASEDYYLRWPLGAFARLIRVTAAVLTLILPGFYIAAVAYHPEMVPTPLLLAIASSRATIPFPLWLEVLIMEFSFQLVREAGTRVPSVIGPTIGIVGALILGQAAVSANLISPVPVVLVSITALGSFVVPNYQASYTLQLLRFVMIGAATVWGFYGLAFGIFLLSLHLCDLTSFGVPFTSPVGPYRPGAGDIIVKAPPFTMEARPRFLRPQDPLRQPEVSRQWDQPDQGPGKGEDDG